MPGVEVRVITADDIAEYNAYRKRVADEPDNMITWNAGEYMRTVDEERERVLRVLNHPDQQILVADAQGKVVGSCACYGAPQSALRHAVGLGIDVDREFRGQGVGDALLRSMLEWARSHPVIRRVELEVFTHNRPAINLYLKYGFVTEGLKRQAYFKYGRYVDAYFMALLLDKPSPSSPL